MNWIALSSLLLLLVTWVLYPLGAALIARRRSAVVPVTPSAWPRVSVVIATRDEPSAIARRVANLRQSDYPVDLLEVVVGLDRMSRSPVESYVKAVPGVRCVQGQSPGGKAATLNAAAAAASGDVLVFTDTHQTFDPDAITELVRYLAAGACTGASGLYLPRPKGQREALDFFWAFEIGLRRSEARIRGVVGVSGSIYAIRRDLWTPLPSQLINDDLFVPLELAMRGNRVGFCESAVARDSRSFSRREEFNRRVRTLTGVLQLCAWRPALLAPWRNPLWIEFACHKILRVATPYLVALLLVGLTPSVLSLPVTLWLGVAVILGAAFAAFSMLRPTAAAWLLGQAAWSLGLLAVPLIATLNALRRRWNVWSEPVVGR